MPPRGEGGGGGVRPGKALLGGERLCDPRPASSLSCPPLGSYVQLGRLWTQLKTLGLPDASCPEEPWTRLPSISGTVPISEASGPVMPLVLCFLLNISISG